jgi:hypothetical protein
MLTKIAEVVFGILAGFLMLWAFDVWPADYWTLSKDRLSYTWCTDKVRWPVLKHCRVIHWKNTL